MDGIGWDDEGRIQRANLDGSDVESLLTDLDFAPRELAVDMDGSRAAPAP